MILGRLIRAVGAEHHSLIPVRWVTRIFVTGDVISFSLQAGGGGVQAAGTLEMFDIGEKIILAGLWAQIVIFGFFVVTSVLFHSRLVRSPTFLSERGDVAWRRHFAMLYAASGLILVRSIFRVVEYIQGNSGYLISHEIFLYVFDTILMAAVMALFAIWYVGDLERKKQDMAYVETPCSSDGMMEDLGHRRNGSGTAA